MMRDGRPRGLPLSQPHRRHRRRASRLPLLDADRRRSGQPLPAHRALPRSPRARQLCRRARRPAPRRRVRGFRAALRVDSNGVDAHRDAGRSAAAADAGAHGRAAARPARAAGGDAAGRGAARRRRDRRRCASSRSSSRSSRACCARISRRSSSLADRRRAGTPARRASRARRRWSSARRANRVRAMPPSTSPTSAAIWCRAHEARAVPPRRRRAARGRRSPARRASSGSRGGAALGTRSARREAAGPAAADGDPARAGAPRPRRFRARHAPVPAAALPVLPLAGDLVRAAPPRQRAASACGWRSRSSGRSSSSSARRSRRAATCCRPTSPMSWRSCRTACRRSPAPSRAPAHRARATAGRSRELFADFDETPLAAASIAQVHAARLPDGTRGRGQGAAPGHARA